MNKDGISLASGSVLVNVSGMTPVLAISCEARNVLAAVVPAALNVVRMLDALESSSRVSAKVETVMV